MQRSRAIFNQVRAAAIVATFCLLSTVGLAAPAQAESNGQATIDSIVVESGSAAFHSTVTLSFDTPIFSKEASKIRANLSAKNGVAPVTKGALAPRAGGTPMWCLGYHSEQDANSWFEIQYNCGTPRTLTWSWKLSAALKVIIVSPVNEIGLDWWRNGVHAGKNAPHPTLPKDYTIHGTMIQSTSTMILTIRITPPSDTTWAQVALAPCPGRAQ